MTYTPCEPRFNRPSRWCLDWILIWHESSQPFGLQYAGFLTSNTNRVRDAEAGLYVCEYFLIRIGNSNQPLQGEQDEDYICLNLPVPGTIARRPTYLMEVLKDCHCCPLAKSRFL